jgi:hypothetical protein
MSTFESPPLVSAELAVPETLLDVMTGEVLPATTENAHTALVAIREREQQLREVKAAVTAFVIEQSRVQGTKTLHAAGGDVVLSGGVATEYDPQALADCLREVGCPEERISEAVVEEISYKVNRSVLRQLVGANENYKAAAELAEREVVKPWRVSAK